MPHSPASQDHEHLGHVGDVVEVRAGYMRTSLYPNRVAVYATPANLRKLEKEVSQCFACAINSLAAGAP